MQIYSNGKDRVLTGKFPAKFKLRKDGIDVPFIRTGADSVRLSGEVPEGDLDVLEVIREIAKPQNSLMTDLRFAMINESEVDRIEKLSNTLEEKGNAFEKKGEILEKHAKALLEKEDKNTKAIQDTNSRLESMAKAVGKEIQADREALKATDSGIKQVISETAEVLDAKLQAHEVAKNPHKISKKTIGLDAVDNTSDLDKPISKATQKALNDKADKKDIDELDKKISESSKKQESLQKSIENANLYGGVGGDIIRGGKKGQFLSKESNKDGDYKWVDVSGSGAVDSVNGKTGVVVLDYNDVGAASSAQGSKADTAVQPEDLTAYETKATIQTLSATDSITLADNTIYNGGEQTALTIALPTTVDVSFLCEIDFTSGATPSTLSYPNSIKWVGDDVSGGLFVPVASKRYTVVIYYDGVEYVGVVKGVA